MGRRCTLGNLPRAGSGCGASVRRGMHAGFLTAPHPPVFRDISAVNYDMTCEGLAHWNGGLAWQVYFRQRRDKPIRDRVYRLQESGPSYPVALKGRAWIA